MVLEHSKLPNHCRSNWKRLFLSACKWRQWCWYLQDLWSRSLFLFCLYRTSSQKFPSAEEDQFVWTPVFPHFHYHLINYLPNLLQIYLMMIIIHYSYSYSMKNELKKTHLSTAIRTKRRIGRTISRIVINQCFFFRSRFFHVKTRNFENILISYYSWWPILQELIFRNNSCSSCL